MLDKHALPAGNRRVEASNGHASASVLDVQDHRKFDYETSSSSSFEVGLFLNGAYKGSQGLASSQNQFTVGAGANITHGTNQNLTYDLEWKMVERAWFCRTSPQAGVDTGYHDWVPNSWTGGDGNRSWTVFTCSAANKTSHTGDLWVSRSLTVTNVAAFIVVGAVGLKSQLSTNTNTKLTYVKRATTTSYNLCGNNSTVLTANQSREA
ncbi:MAG: hypothetical protein U0S36_05050 [Candidatus Nanopelagicales bacterium]